MAGTFTLTLNGTPITGLDNVAEMTPVIITRPFDFGAPDKDKYIDSVLLGIEHTVPFYMGEAHFAYGNRLSDVMPFESVTWKVLRTFTDPSTPIFLRKTARFFALKIVDRYCRESWKLSSIQWYGEILGVKR